MEDVVGIIGKASSGNDVAFMTWGRLFDPGDDAELRDIIALHSSMFAGGPVSIAGLVLTSVFRSARPVDFLSSDSLSFEADCLACRPR